MAALGGENAVRKAAPLIAATAATIALTVCASLTNQVAAAPSSSPTSCAGQLAAWRSSGAADYLHAVIDDMDGLRDSMAVLADDLSTGADTSSDQSQLDSTAGTLQSDAQQAAGDLPPSCVPGMRAADSAMLDYAVKAATETESAVTKMGAGIAKAAIAGLLAARGKITAGEKKFDSAVSDAQGFGGAG